MEYKTKAIEDILFLPENLKVNPGDIYSKLVELGEEAVEVKYIRLYVQLREESESTISVPVGGNTLPCISKMTTIREGTIDLPYAIWKDAVTGYDPELKEPILDETKFRLILKMYKIDLA